MMRDFFVRAYFMTEPDVVENAYVREEVFFSRLDMHSMPFHAYLFISLNP